MIRQSENRKDKIVGLAINYLKRSGIKGTRMDALAREAGISTSQGSCPHEPSFKPIITGS